jgi:hypothetical protein
MTPAAYLQFYVNELVKNGQVYQVNFDKDPTLNYLSQKESLPLSNLVFGFANMDGQQLGRKDHVFQAKAH